MISAAERQERLEAIEDVVGTQRAEGIQLSPATRALMEQYAEGELTLDEICSALDQQARGFAQLASVA